MKGQCKQGLTGENVKENLQKKWQHFPRNGRLTSTKAYGSLSRQTSASQTKYSQTGGKTAQSFFVPTDRRSLTQVKKQQLTFPGGETETMFIHAEEKKLDCISLSLELLKGCNVWSGMFCLASPSSPRRRLIGRI